MCLRPRLVGEGLARQLGRMLARVLAKILARPPAVVLARPPARVKDMVKESVEKASRQDRLTLTVSSNGPSTSWTYCPSGSFAFEAILDLDKQRIPL